MREEYRAIVDAGFILQLDDPGLPAPGTCSIPAERRGLSALRVTAGGNSQSRLEGIPVDRVRYHICWGSWHGPHTTDFPLRDIVGRHAPCQRPGVLDTKPATVRHEHEYKSGAT